MQGFPSAGAQSPRLFPGCSRCPQDMPLSPGCSLAQVMRQARGQGLSRAAPEGREGAEQCGNCTFGCSAISHAPTSAPHHHRCTQSPGEEVTAGGHSHYTAQRAAEANICDAVTNCWFLLCSTAPLLPILTFFFRTSWSGFGTCPLPGTASARCWGHSLRGPLANTAAL